MTISKGQVYQHFDEVPSLRSLRPTSPKTRYEAIPWLGYTTYRNLKEGWHSDNFEQKEPPILLKELKPKVPLLSWQWFVYRGRAPDDTGCFWSKFVRRQTRLLEPNTNTECSLYFVSYFVLVSWILNWVLPWNWAFVFTSIRVVGIRASKLQATNVPRTCL